MRRAILILLVLLPLCACRASAPQPLDLDLYSDRGFAQRVDAIFADAASYENAAIRLTGQYYESGGYAYILRPTPDGEQRGFELRWEGEAPAPGAWILAVGTLTSYIEGEAHYLQVSAQQLFETGRTAEEITVGEETFLADLAELYDAAEAHLGARITLTGRYGLDEAGHYIARTAAYRDGRAGQVGLQILSLSELPAAGAWVTATGTLGRYTRDGEEILILIDAVLTPSEPMEEPIKEAP